MVGKSSSEKQAQWRRRLRRFRSSGLTVAAFCAAEGVSVPSFYQWRRKLAGSTPRLAGSSRPASRRSAQSAQRAFQRIVVTPAPAMSVRLPGGVEIELPTAHPETVRTLVAALLGSRPAD